MRGLAGYSFKAGKLSPERRQMLEDYLLVFEEYEGASEWKDGDKTYLYRPKNSSFSIIGVGAYDAEKSDGIIWGASEFNILQALAHIMPEQDFYPYKVEENAIYFVEDGEVYFKFRKGARVSTAEGEGKIFSIDDLHDICVELDGASADIVHEFTVKELGKIKEG